MAMCREHKSQSQWMKDNYTETVGKSDDDYFETVRINALYRGMQCGVKYAEGFITANDAFRIRPYRILP
jgi:hypothetical protein